MSQSRQDSSLFLSVNKRAKGLACYFFDSADFWHRRVQQRIARMRKFPVNTERKLHLLCVRRPEYVNHAIRCANSFWQFHPEFPIVVWCDSITFAILNSRSNEFDRKDRISINQIEDHVYWQETKLEIISNKMSQFDFFSDVDIFWNGNVNFANTPILFLREYSFQDFSFTKQLIRILNLDEKKTWFMLNVSFVYLAGLTDSIEFKERVWNIFKTLKNFSENDQLGARDIKSINRMSEQLAISIAVQEFGAYEVLKESDSIMDGGILESFYFGATNGY
jgi:hypothetical protein